MSTAEDILEDAKRLTRVYGHQVRKPEVEPSTISVVPGRVYVLKQNSLVLAVLATQERAVHEAESLMVVMGGLWREMAPHSLWRQGDLWIEITAHEVR